MKKVADVEESWLAFKMNNYQRKLTVSTGLMAGTGATLRTIRDAKKFKNYAPNIPAREPLHGTKTNGIALKRGDAEVCLLDGDRNRVVVTLKKSLCILS